jgi:hypothetical protein
VIVTSFGDSATQLRQPPTDPGVVPADPLAFYNNQPHHLFYLFHVSNNQHHITTHTKDCIHKPQPQPPYLERTFNRKKTLRILTAIMNKLSPLSNTNDADVPSAQMEGMDIHSNVVTPGKCRIFRYSRSGQTQNLGVSLEKSLGAVKWSRSIPCRIQQSDTHLFPLPPYHYVFLCRHHPSLLSRPSLPSSLAAPIKATQGSHRRIRIVRDRFGQDCRQERG